MNDVTNTPINNSMTSNSITSNGITSNSITSKVAMTDHEPEQIHHQLDTQGLICPEPVMMLHRAVRNADAGEIIEVLATDPATTRDIPNFCRHLGHQLLSQMTIENTAKTDNVYRYLVQKKMA